MAISLTDVVEFLSRGLTQEQLDSENSSAESCMHLAARNGHVDVIKVLQKAGASKFPQISVRFFNSLKFIR